jgi:hypothetical protein
MKFAKLLQSIKEQSGSEPAKKAIATVRQLSNNPREISPNALPYTGKAKISQNTMSRLISAAISARKAREVENLGRNIDIRA